MNKAAHWIKIVVVLVLIISTCTLIFSQNIIAFIFEQRKIVLGVSDNKLTESLARLGTLGDSYGIINSILSFLSVFLISITLLYQQIEIGNQSKELNSIKEEEIRTRKSADRPFVVIKSISGSSYDEVNNHFYYRYTLTLGTDTIAINIKMLDFIVDHRKIYVGNSFMKSHIQKGRSNETMVSRIDFDLLDSMGRGNIPQLFICVEYKNMAGGIFYSIFGFPIQETVLDGQIKYIMETSPISSSDYSETYSSFFKYIYSDTNLSEEEIQQMALRLVNG